MLQSKTLVKGQTLAEHFGISLRTVYRDIHTLQNAGVPIIGEPGSGYSIMQGYKLPPILFTNDEVLSFAAVEKLAEKHLDDILLFHFKKASEKLKNVFKYNDKLSFETLSNNITIHQPVLKFNKSLPNGLTTIFKGITDKKQLNIHYQKKQDDEAENRIIEPLGIFLKHRYWYIYAYCLLRKDYRHFRIDRIHKVNILSHPFTIQHPDFKNDFAQDNRKVYEAIIAVKKEHAAYLDWDKHDNGFISEETKGDIVEMKFRVLDIYQHFPRWVLTYGDFIKILAPQELIHNYQHLLNKIQAFQTREI